MFSKQCCFLLIFFAATVVRAQNFSVNYFRSPLDIPHEYSGSFAEFRTNHFHTGVDFKTKGRVGYKVYSVADGWISRINIAPYGYGLAIYITHPNGYTSQYGHMLSFSDTITAYLKNKQYQQKSYAIDLYLKEGEFKVVQGQVIGLSGNSGSSGGPHLHFEIRDQITQEIINPIGFGFKIKDTVAPVIEEMKIYDRRGMAELYKIRGENCVYALKNQDTLCVDTAVYFGLKYFDRNGDMSNKNGVYQLQLFSNDSLVYRYVANRFGFNQANQINDIIDYACYKKTGKAYHLTKRSPGNSLKMIEGTDDGIFHFHHGEIRRMRYVLEDFSGNISEFVFYVHADNKNENKEKVVPKKQGNQLNYMQENIFAVKDFKVVFPKGVLLDNMVLEYKIKESENKKFISKVHSINDKYTPLYGYIKVYITCPELPDSMLRKVTMAQINAKGVAAPISTTIVDSMIMGKTKYFGDYVLMMDTVSPKITPVNIAKNKPVGNLKSIKIRIKDDFTGISTYNAYLNEEWVLMSFDPKNNLLQYDIDDRLLKGENQFRLVVTDAGGNKAEYQTTLYR